MTNQFAAKITLPKFNYLSAFFPREPSEEVRLQRSHAAGHMNKGGLQLTAPQLTDQFTLHMQYYKGLHHGDGINQSI